jgi:hypothetical protein
MIAAAQFFSYSYLTLLSTSTPKATDERQQDVKRSLPLGQCLHESVDAFEVLRPISHKDLPSVGRTGLQLEPLIGQYEPVA